MRYNIIIILLASACLFVGCKNKEGDPELMMIQELDTYLGETFTTIDNRIKNKGFTVNKSDKNFCLYESTNTNHNPVFYGLRFNDTVTVAYYAIEDNTKGSSSYNYMNRALRYGDECERYVHKDNYRLGESYFKNNTTWVDSTHAAFSNRISKNVTIVIKFYEYWIKNNKRYRTEYNEGTILIEARYL